ncbi:MAG: NmrA family NAD(P)-binding protein [Pseudomonadota bacterium]
MTDIRTVAVFGASGRQGSAQISALLEAGYWPRGLMRNPARFPFDIPDGLSLMAADYTDEASLQRAMTKADAVFLTPPSFTDVGQGFDNAVRVAGIATEMGVKRLVLNTSMYVPDEPMGEPIYDGRLALENAIEATGVPLTVFRPVLFMDNLLTDWVRPKLNSEDAFIYPHGPHMQANWISLADVGRFMTASLADDSLIGERMVIGGPETFQPADVAAILSTVLGREISYRKSTPAEFGELMNGIFSDVLDIPKEAHIQSLADFYTYNNASNAKPMVVDMAAVLERIPVKLTRLEDWARQQDWSMPDGDAPRPVGG